MNDPPTLDAIGNLAIDENAGLQTVGLAGIGSGAANETQTLTVSATSSNPGLIPHPTVVYTSPNAGGSLTFTPVAGVSGTATITVTVNDGQAQSNTVTRTFTVTVNETEPPVIVCPANVVTNAAPGQSVQVVSYSPTASDNCPGVTVSCNPPSGSSFSTGTTPVSCTATDTAGNSNSCTFTVTVTATADLLDELDETVIVDITGVTNGTEAAPQQVTVTITDDDDPPAVTLTVDPASIAENGVVLRIGNRTYRVRGLEKNLAFDVLKVNVLARRDDVEKFYVDTFDLYAARARNVFIKDLGESTQPVAAQKPPRAVRGELPLQRHRHTGAEAPNQSREGPSRMLFVTQSAGFVHGSVRRPEGQLAPAEIAITQLGEQTGLFRVDCTQDVEADFTKENLQNYDVIAFYTTGDLPIQKEDLDYFFNDWLRQEGHGVLGFHSATDTFHNYEPFWDMIGGTFIRHPWNSGHTVTLTNHEPHNPIVAPFGPEFVIRDEIYMYRNWQPEKVRVLMSLDMSKCKTKKPYMVPVSWVKNYGDGRMFYTNLGHNEGTWTNPQFLAHVTGGIRWALGQVEGDATPNPDLQQQLQAKAKHDTEAAGQ